MASTVLLVDAYKNKSICRLLILYIAFSIRNLYHNKSSCYIQNPWQLQRTDPRAYPLFLFPKAAPQERHPQVQPQFPPFHIFSSWANSLDSLSCLHFFRTRNKRPTRSKMKTTTPMEPETAVAAVPKLRRANKRKGGHSICPVWLWW